MKKRFRKSILKKNKTQKRKKNTFKRNKTLKRKKIKGGKSLFSISQHCEDFEYIREDENIYVKKVEDGRTRKMPTMYLLEISEDALINMRETLEKFLKKIQSIKKENPTLVQIVSKLNDIINEIDSLSGKNIKKRFNDYKKLYKLIKEIGKNHNIYFKKSFTGEDMIKIKEILRNYIKENVNKSVFIFDETRKNELVEERVKIAWQNYVQNISNKWLLPNKPSLLLKNCNVRVDEINSLLKWISDTNFSANYILENIFNTISTSSSLKYIYSFIEIMEWFIQEQDL